MKIERISNNSLKVYISRQYLQSRGLSAKIILENSEAFDHLIWDVVDHANIEFGQDFNENQLDIVHIFDDNGGIEVTISHSYDETSNERISHEDSDNFMMEHFGKLLFSAANSMRNNNRNRNSNPNQPADTNKETDALVNKLIGVNGPSSPEDNQSTDQYKSLLKKGIVANENIISENSEKNPNIQTAPPAVNIPAKKRTLSVEWDILVFPDFNDMVEFFIRNKNFKTIASSLYTYRGAYYLLLKPNKNNINLLNKLEAMSLDYNATFLPAETFLPLLRERGKVIMENGAISKIIKHFNF